MLQKWLKTPAIAIVAALVGLRKARVYQWLEVLEEEARTMGFKTWAKMILAGLDVSLFHPVQSAEFKRRMRICQRCPVYDKELRRCRPYTGSPDGCGCYAPFKALARQSCWIRQIDPHRGW
jgi:Fe-S-cluster containining protein